MIWLTNFPLPPSVNEYLFAHDNRLVMSEVHRKYKERCVRWGDSNRRSLEPVKRKLFLATEDARQKSMDLILRVDVFVAFQYSRVFTTHGKCERIDANNYLKALLDGLSLVIGIDDKHFFAGNCEKVTTRSKELECSVVRIQPTRPRTLEEIRNIMLKETRSTAVS